MGPIYGLIPDPNRGFEIKHRLSKEMLLAPKFNGKYWQKMTKLGHKYFILACCLPNVDFIRKISPAKWPLISPVLCPSTALRALSVVNGTSGYCMQLNIELIMEMFL